MARNNCSVSVVASSLSEANEAPSGKEEEDLWTYGTPYPPCARSGKTHQCVRFSSYLLTIATGATTLLSGKVYAESLANLLVVHLLRHHSSVIAHMVGCASESHLAMHFKRLTGLTPKHYR